MGRGSGSKRLSAGSYGGRGGGQTTPKTTPQQIAAVNKVLDYIDTRNQTRSGYNYNNLDRDGDIVNKNSNVGDEIEVSFTNRNSFIYKKVGDNLWQYDSFGRLQTTDTQNILASVSSLNRTNGKLKFKVR